MLTQEQIKNLKAQLIQHIEASFPEDKKQFAISQIEAMNSEELEEFLVKNKLLKKEGAGHGQGGQCVFCSIVFGDIKAYKMAENSKAIAVLEINPVSRGHTIIIPKEHIPDYGKEPSNGIRKLIEDISKIIKKELKPRGVTVENTNLFGHQVVNIIPNYKNNELVPENPERHHATEEELDELQEILTKKTKSRKGAKKTVKRIEQLKEKIWLPKRIP